MVDVAKACGADAVSHGCTGKGNDQVLYSHCRSILAHRIFLTGALTCKNYIDESIL